MGRQFNVFDFFSYIIPGFVYLFSVLLFISIFDDSGKIINILLSPGAYNITLGAIIAYILGRAGGDKIYGLKIFLYKSMCIEDNMSSELKKLGNENIDKLKSIIEKSSIDIEKSLITNDSIERYIALKSEKLKIDIERQMALRIFSRNISASFQIFGTVAILLGFTLNALWFIVSVFSFYLAYIFLSLTKRYAEIYNRLIFDSILAIITKEKEAV